MKATPSDNPGDPGVKCRSVRGRCSRWPSPSHAAHLTPELGHQSSRDGGNVEDHLLGRVADFADAERATWVQAAACRMVAALFDAGNVAACRVPVEPLSDLEFAEALVCCELELIAAGDDPVQDLPANGRHENGQGRTSCVRRNRRAPRRTVAPSLDGIEVGGIAGPSCAGSPLSARRVGTQTRFRGCYRRDGPRSACHRRTYPP